MPLTVLSNFLVFLSPKSHGIKSEHTTNDCKFFSLAKSFSHGGFKWYFAFMYGCKWVCLLSHIEIRTPSRQSLALWALSQVSHSPKKKNFENVKNTNAKKSENILMIQVCKIDGCKKLEYYFFLASAKKLKIMPTCL